MVQPGSVAELIDLAIAAECNAADLYQRMAGLFFDHPEISRFWQEYSQQEVEHARWIGMLRDHTSAERLAMPAEPAIWVMVKNLQRVSVNALLKSIETLQDAWEMANEIEHGETNAVFEFLIAHFANDPETQSFLRSQLNEHLTHLLEAFPAHYRSPAVRAAVYAMHGQA